MYYEEPWELEGVVAMMLKGGKDRGRRPGWDRLDAKRAGGFP